MWPAAPFVVEDQPSLGTRRVWTSGELRAPIAILRDQVTELTGQVAWLSARLTAVETRLATPWWTRAWRALAAWLQSLKERI